jgi:hypothetical protein
LNGAYEATLTDAKTYWNWVMSDHSGPPPVFLHCGRRGPSTDCHEAGLDSGPENDLFLKHLSHQAVGLKPLSDVDRKAASLRNMLM